MGKILDFVKSLRAKVGVWARLGTDDSDMTPRSLLQIIMDPDTCKPLPLVGLLAPGEDCIGFAFTPAEAYELAELLIDCANEIETRPLRRVVALDERPHGGATFDGTSYARVPGGATFATASDDEPVTNPQAIDEQEHWK